MAHFLLWQFPRSFNLTINLILRYVKRGIPGNCCPDCLTLVVPERAAFVVCHQNHQHEPRDESPTDPPYTTGVLSRSSLFPAAQPAFLSSPGSCCSSRRLE